MYSSIFCWNLRKVALTFTFHLECPKFSANGKHPWRKNNTATDNVANLLIFLCILDGQLKDTALDGPSEDES